MGLELTTIGDPLLRRRARPLGVSEILSAEMQRFLVSMRETMAASQGVGLAAPQVGQGVQLIILEDSEVTLARIPPERRQALGRRLIQFQALANPVVTPLGDERVLAYEGCLSILGAQLCGMVERYRSVHVEGLGADGRELSFDAHDWHARILQHEVDHLDGVLILDKWDALTACDRHHFLARWRHLDAEEVRREFDGE